MRARAVDLDLGRGTYLGRLIRNLELPEYLAMAPLRWGIYSAGKISHDFVVGLKTLPEAEHTVMAVAARSEQDAATFAKTHSIAKYYGSYSQLAEDAEVSTGSIFS